MLVALLFIQCPCPVGYKASAGLALAILRRADRVQLLEAAPEMMFIADADLRGDLPDQSRCRHQQFRCLVQTPPPQPGQRTVICRGTEAPFQLPALHPDSRCQLGDLPLITQLLCQQRNRLLHTWIINTITWSVVGGCGLWVVGCGLWVVGRTPARVRKGISCMDTPTLQGEHRHTGAVAQMRVNSGSGAG